MRLSRILGTDDVEVVGEAVPMRRILFWILVGIAIVVGIVLFFKYARFLAPLLD